MNAITHLTNGIFVSSMTVPSVTVYCSRHSLHWIVPGRDFSPLNRVAFLLAQCGQTRRAFRPANLFQDKASLLVHSVGQLEPTKYQLFHPSCTDSS